MAAAAAVEGLVHYVDRVAADLDHGSTEFLVGVADTLLMCALAADPSDAQVCLSVIIICLVGTNPPLPPPLNPPPSPFPP